MNFNDCKLKKLAVPDNYPGPEISAEYTYCYDHAQAKPSGGNVIGNDGTLLFTLVFPGENYTVASNISKVAKDAFKFSTDIKLNIEGSEQPVAFEEGAFNDATITSLYLDREVSVNPNIFPTTISSVEFGRNVRTISANIFNGCENIETLTIPANVKTIADKAFLGCKNINRIYPLGMQAPILGAHTFDDCVYISAEVPLPDDADLLSYRDTASNWPLFLRMTDSGLAGERLEYYGLSYRVIGEGMVEVAKGDNYAELTDVEIPMNVHIWTPDEGDTTGLNGTINQYYVVGIASGAFEGLTNLTSVRMPYTLEEIGRNAFKDCTGLTTLVFGQSLRRINISAFEGCSALASIDASATSLEQIADSAFLNCPALASFNPGKNLRQIGVSAFTGCSKLTSFDFAGTALEYIGAHAFDGVKLTEIKIGKDLKVIGDYTFNNNNRLTSLSIPQDGNLVEIGAHAFAKNPRLRSDIILPDSLERLGAMAFNGANQVKNVEFPANRNLVVGDSAFFQCQRIETAISRGSIVAKSLGAYAFSGCDKLAKAHMKFDEIGEYAFNDNRTLTDLNLEGNGRLHPYALNGCTALTAAKLNMGIISTNVAAGCSALDSLDLSGNVRIIEKETFKDMSTITKVEFGLNLEKIGSSAFANTKINKVLFPSAEEPDPVIVVERYALPANSVKELYLGNRMKSFWWTRESLEYCDLGQSVQSFPYYIPYSYNSLTIPGSVQGRAVIWLNPKSEIIPCIRIEYSAEPLDLAIWTEKYDNDEKIDTLIIDRLLIRTSSSAPDWDLNQKNARCPRNVIFSDNPDRSLNFSYSPLVGGEYQNIYVGSSVKVLNGYKNYYQERGYITFAEGIEEINNICPQNEDVRYPASLKKITEFGVGSKTKSVIFADGGENLEIVSKGSKGTGKALAKVYIGRNITGIDNLFEGTTTLKKAIIGNDDVVDHAPVTALPKGIFKGCTALENAVLTDHLTTIGEEAFDGCSSLKVVSFSENLKTVGLNAYRDCTGLERIVARGLVPAEDVNQGSIFDADIEDNVPLYYPDEAEDAYLDSSSFLNFTNLYHHSGNIVKGVSIDPAENIDFDELTEGFSQSVNEIAQTHIELVDAEAPAAAPRRAPRRAAAEGSYGENTPIYWFSPNPEIASIDENNILTIHKNEPTEIWAFALDGSDEKAVIGVNRFLAGDVNNDRLIDTRDINDMIGHIAAPAGSTINLKAADLNKNGDVNTGDLNILINKISKN